MMVVKGWVVSYQPSGSVFKAVFKASQVMSPGSCLRYSACNSDHSRQAVLISQCGKLSLCNWALPKFGG